jgi:hypothetical protein
VHSPFAVDVEVNGAGSWGQVRLRPIKGPLKTDNLYTFEAESGGTLVVLTDDIDLNGIFKVFLPVMPSLVRSGYRMALTPFGGHRVMRLCDRPLFGWCVGFRMLLG